MPSPVYLAIDLGATSGRVMAGIIEKGAIQLEEVHRFPTRGVEVQRSWHWDVTDIFQHVIHGLSKAASAYGDRVAGVSTDTWGVDYGLLDAHGQLLVNPYMYRDGRTEGVEEADEIHRVS